jgi:hypothetical protein
VSRSASLAGIGAETACAGGRPMRRAALFCSAALFFAFLCGCCNGRREPEAAGRRAGRFLLSAWSAAAGESGASSLLAVVVYDDRLTCTPCLESLSEFFDTLRNTPCGLRSAHLLLVAARSEAGSPAQRKKMEAWSEAHRLGWPLRLMPADSLRETILEQSSVLVVDGGGDVLLHEPIPLAPGAIGQIMKRLCGR